LNKQVDLIVLCNVLHEIPALEWPRTFESLAKSLAPNGSVIVIEDQEPAVGELPHWRGFVILDATEMRTLCGSFGAVTDLSAAVPNRYLGRISIFQIGADQLPNVTAETVRRALDAVTQRAIREMKRLRAGSSDESQRAGRLHAFYAMLWTNSQMALSG
jgi:hypothetical protein